MFALAPHLLFAVCIVSVGIAAQSPGIALGGPGAYALGLFWVRARGPAIGKRLEAALAVMAVVASVVYCRWRGEHPLNFLQYWLAGILVIRAFRRADRRDYAFGFLVAAGVYAHVGRVYSDLPFLFLTLVNLVLLPYALFYYLAYFGGFRKESAPPAVTRVPFSVRQFRLMTALSLLLFVTTALLFLALPRAQTGFAVARQADPADANTGFSGNMSLGSFNRVRRQRSLAMVVETTEPQYWRGAVLDFYDGGAWRATSEFDWRRPGQAGPVRTGGRNITRRFRLLDLSRVSNRFFSCGNIVSLRRVRTPKVVWINDLYAIIGVREYRPSAQQAVYEVVSQDDEFVGIGALRPNRWRMPFDPDRWISEEEVCLQVPTNTPERVRELARSITRGLGTTGEKAKAVQDYLRASCRYATEDLDSGGTDPLEHFLFRSRRGHCEYFATAMAILLRCAGERARVVQGFAPGTYADGECIVRLSDAHLWTEVFYPGRGWKMYDPTPGAADREAGAGTPRLVERLELAWTTHVLNYDGTARLKLVAWFRAVTPGEARSVVAALDSFRLHLAALAALLLLLGVVSVRRRRRFGLAGAKPLKRRLAFGGDPAGRVRGYFEQYLEEIARKGYIRNPGTTPNDLVAAMERDRAPAVADSRVLTTLFYHSRFGGVAQTPADERAARDSLKRVRLWARG